MGCFLRCGLRVKGWRWGREGSCCEGLVAGVLGVSIDIKSLDAGACFLACNMLLATCYLPATYKFWAGLDWAGLG